MNGSTNQYADVGLIDFRSSAPIPGDLDVRWNHGVRSSRHSEPPIQVHAYDRHTYILRQSKTVSYEAPFLFLLFGNERALLLDSGATRDPALFPLRATVDALIADWLGEHPRERYELVVAHTHAHGDHVAGDEQFADRPGTTVVGCEPEQVQEFFGFRAWPAETVELDLGGRVLEVIGSPGHHRAAITVHDPWTGILFTGDTVYPGRLYAFDFAAFTETLGRLVEFTERREVTWVFGCHVEMSKRPGRDYPLGCRYQPEELAPQMTADQLRAVHEAAVAAIGRPGVHRHDVFVLYNGPCTRQQLGLLARGLAHRAIAALRR